MPASKVYPRLIGVRHQPEYLEEAYKVIDALPAHSTVALELEASHPSLKYPPRVRENVVTSERFFQQLAQRAKERGHSVYWMEKPSSFDLPADRKLHTILEANFEELERHPTDSVKRLRVGKTIRTHRRQALRLGFLTSKWRSKIMARMLARREWKPTDVAISGNVHAFNLSELLNKPVEQYVGMHLSPQSAHERMRERIAVQEQYAKQLEAARGRRKLVKKALLPVKLALLPRLARKKA